MKFPCLILPQYCKTTIDVVVYEEGISEDGGPIERVFEKIKCNYQDGAKIALTSEKKLVEITGKVFIPGDLCPELAVISAGTVTVNKETRRILKGIKARNPDGTVNYTELQLK